MSANTADRLVGRQRQLGLRHESQNTGGVYRTFQGTHRRAKLDNNRMFALCYTQLTDVEQEQNGLYTYAREPKFDPKIIYDILSRKGQPLRTDKTEAACNMQRLPFLFSRRRSNGRILGAKIVIIRKSGGAGYNESARICVFADRAELRRV